MKVIRFLICWIKSRLAYIKWWWHRVIFYVYANVNEFHHTLDIDIFIALNLPNNAEISRYYKDIERRRAIAHSRSVDH